MPVIKSAIKKMRIDKRRTQKNRAVRTRIHTLMSKARNTQDAGIVATIYSLLDTAAKRHIIHKNRAQRLKSRVARFVGT